MLPSMAVCCKSLYNSTFFSMPDFKQAVIQFIFAVQEGQLRDKLKAQIGHYKPYQLLVNNLSAVDLEQPILFVSLWDEHIMGVDVRGKIYKQISPLWGLSAPCLVWLVTELLTGKSADKRLVSISIVPSAWCTIYPATAKHFVSAIPIKQRYASCPMTNAVYEL